MTATLQYLVVIALVIFAALWSTGVFPGKSRQQIEAADDDFQRIRKESAGIGFTSRKKSEDKKADNPFCTKSLPKFNECGHPITDSYVFGTRQKRVIGGDMVSSPRYYPWMAKLLIRNNSEFTHNCGAVVISKRFLLTAAHCVICNHSEREVELRNKVRIKVDKIIIHAEYKRNCLNDDSKALASRGNDIALVRLQKEIHDVKPICLPLIRCYGFNSSEFTNSRRTTFIAGYGSTSNDVMEASEDLRHVSLKRHSSIGCKNLYSGQGEWVIDRDSMICAGGTKGIDSCFGDSGGPLFGSLRSRSFLIGIASFGSAHCGEGFPSVFTKILPYMSWIKSKTA